MRNGSVNGFSLRPDSILRFFFLSLYSPSFFFLPLSDRFRINYWISGTSSLPSSPSRTIYHSRSRKSSSFPSTSPIQTFKEDASGLDWLPLCVKAASLRDSSPSLPYFVFFRPPFSLSLFLPLSTRKTIECTRSISLLRSRFHSNLPRFVRSIYSCFERSSWKSGIDRIGDRWNYLEKFCFLLILFSFFSSKERLTFNVACLSKLLSVNFSLANLYTFPSY